MRVFTLLQLLQLVPKLRLGTHLPEALLPMLRNDSFQLVPKLCLGTHLLEALLPMLRNDSRRPDPTVQPAPPRPPSVGKASHNRKSGFCQNGCLTGTEWGDRKRPATGCWGFCPPYGAFLPTRQIVALKIKAEPAFVHSPLFWEAGTLAIRGAFQNLGSSEALHEGRRS